MTSVYNLKDECSISAFSLALSIAADNPELASKLSDLAEQANDAGLFHEALREGALQGVEGDVGKLSHSYSLKEESAEMKFRAVLFGGVFDKTAQGDEALRIIADEILNSGGTVSEGIELYRLIGELDLSSLTEVAKIMTGGDLEAAKKMVDNLHTKLSYYIGSEYSVVSSGSKTKLDGIIKEYKSKIDSAQKKIDAFEKKLGKVKGKVKNLFRWLDNDIEKLKKIKANTIEGKNELSNMADKYGVKKGADLKPRLEKKLNEIKKAKDDLDKAKKTKAELEAAKEYKDALNGDIKIIEDGGNPFNLISGDQEWRFIKDFNADKSTRAKQYGQYVLARVLLTGGKDLPKEVIDVIKSGISGGVVNYLDEALTEERILEEGRTLEELLARAYTNTADLANNGQLRTIYRQKLLELASDGEISVKDADFIESLINTLQFSSVGSGFSQVLKYNYLVRAAKNLGIEIPDSQGEELWNSIVNLFKKNEKDFGRSIMGDFVKLGNGIELTTRQLLELVAEMLGDTNINKLIASEAVTDREILDIAGKYLIGDAKAGGNRLMELISAAKNAPTTDDTRGIILKAITGQNVPKDVKVGFFNFRKGLKASPDVEARAKFMERLSNANTLEIPNGTIPDLTDNLERRIAEYKGGFIIVNDSQWKMNRRLADAVDKFNKSVEKPEDKIKVIFPSGGLLGTITSVDGKLIYRTVNSNSFNNLVRNIAIRALGQSDIDARFSKELQGKLLRGDAEAIAEYNKLLEEDAKEYFGQMLGLGKDAYEKKLPAMLEAATGISFKNYDAITDKVAFWKKIDENFVVGLKTTGNFDQEFVTVADVMREVNSKTPDQLAGELSGMYGLDVKVEMITENGKIKQKIKDAYLHYKLSEDPIELLERKGRLLAVLNGGTADNITVAQFKAMLQSGDFKSFKDIFFHNLNLSDEELEKHAKKISDMIYNSLSAQVAMNLVKMGYQLPMVNVRDLVYDFLMDRLNVNGSFARAFLFKNGLPDTLETLRGIVNEAMPKELRFGYEDGFKYDVTIKEKRVYREGMPIWGHSIADNVIPPEFELMDVDYLHRMALGDLAKEYGLPVEVLDFFVRVTSPGAWGITVEFSNGGFADVLVALKNSVEHGTVAHEVFHGIFASAIPVQEKTALLSEAMRLYNFSTEKEAEEMLADLFSEYFHTGKISLPKTAQEVHTLMGYITRVFKKLRKRIKSVDKYEVKLKKFYDDILDFKYSKGLYGDVSREALVATRKERAYQFLLVRKNLMENGITYDGKSISMLEAERVGPGFDSLSADEKLKHWALRIFLETVASGIAEHPNYTFAEWKALAKSYVAGSSVDLDGVIKEIDSLTEDLFKIDQGMVSDMKVFNSKMADDTGKAAPTTQANEDLAPGYFVRTIERKDDFTQDTYSSLIAMASVKNGERLPTLGSEEEILRGILEKYHDAVSLATKGGKTLSFAEAQKLKIQASHALDMFEQDFLFPRYRQFLTPQERSELMGLKYGLAVATDSTGLKTIKDYNEAILERYRNATNNIIMNSGLFSLGEEGAENMAKEIERRQKELLEQGATMKVINGQMVIVDIREELARELKKIPSNILGLENLRAIGRNGLAQMSNEQVYFLLNVVQLAKNIDNKTNMIINTIYKVNPRLAKIDFFNKYKVSDGVPKILQKNLLINGKFSSKFSNTLGFDNEVKKTILAKIKDVFAREGQLTYKQLEKIVDDSITENKSMLANVVKGRDYKKFANEASVIYKKVFTPYTYLVDVPREVKTSIANILAEQQKGIRQALSLMGEDDRLVQVLDNIAIYGNDGTVKTFREVLDGEPDDINKIIFGADNEIIMGADEAAKKSTEGKSRRARKRQEKENLKLAEAVENNYRDGLQAYLTHSDVVSEAERKLLNTTLTAARQIAKKYTSTNKIAETDNALASINEEIIRRFKADILGLGGKFSRGGQRWDFGGKIQEGILDRWDKVKNRYRSYYSMDLDQLTQVRANNPIDVMALNLAKYFKEIESRLGSLDGIKGVTTDVTINRAFGHLGEVVLNVKTMDGLYSLMSGVEGNQILKFFRFSNPKQLSYVKRFVIGGEGKETIGGYRTYVDRLDEGLDRDWFNKTFATNFSQTEYRKLVQALTGFTIINKKWKRVESALNFANSSNYLLRVAVSYPGQILTIANQSLAYFLRQRGWEDALGIEDLGSVDVIRRRTGALNGTYNEINWFNGYSPDDLDPTSYYNRYGIPDVDDVYKNKKFYSTDDVETIFSKIDEYGAEGTVWDKINDKLTSFFRNTDAYKDNANNIIDGIFARNFKNVAFVRALQTNQVMRFATAEQFARFMASNAPEAMKKRLMDAVISDSGKHFRNILGLGFSGLDRAVSGGNRILPAWASNILVGVAGLFNFRGAWGQNIARQTNNIFLTALRMGKMGLTKEGRDGIALFLARQPEFLNFTSQLFTDLKNSWRLVRFQDNGHLPDEDDEWSWMDFISYTVKNIQFASQWWQGIQSYGTTRIGTEWLESVIKSGANPDIYKDTYGVGAFFNSMQKNMGRNWKAPKFVMNAIAQGVTNGSDAFWAYLGNEWWKLSFGTLRYLMNEDYTAYGYSTEMPSRRTGIPFILTGEADEEGDKAFSYDLANTETWENITNWYEAKKSGDTEAASIYAMNLRDTAFNSSPLLGTVKGVGRTVNGSSLTGSTIKGRMDDMHFYKITNPFDLAEAGDLIAETEAGMALEKYGYYIPSQSTDVKIFIDTIIGQADFRPGNGGFNKSFFNFDNSGHMKNLEESNPKDAAMEMLLSNMKYQRDENWAFVKDEKGNKIVTDYWKNHMDEIERKIHDEDFLIKSNFNFINNWVEQNNKDPNYMLYKKLIGEGLAGVYLEEKINEHINDYNTVFGLKKTEKLTLTELKNSSYYDEVVPKLKSDKLVINGQSIPFLEALATLDESALMEADIKIVERQLSQHGDQEAIKKFFSVNDKGEVNLTTKYESFLEEQGRLSSYLRAGDLDSFLAETASITKVFKKDDPYGLMTTTLLGSRVNQINSSNYLSAEQKAKAINVLFKDNAEFIQQHIPEMISELGSKAEAYIDQMNDSLYGSSLIVDKLVTDNEMNNSKSGRSAALSASDKIKAVIVDLAKAVGDSPKIGTKKYNYNFTPVKFNGSKLLNLVGGKGYSPELPSIAIEKYAPHVDFSLEKDINRNVKGPKTQTISTKKQLSNLESKTAKALEAES